MNATVPKVGLAFELSRSQFIKLKQVQVKIDETVVEEIIPDVPKNETAAAKSDDDTAKPEDKDESD